MDGSRYLQAQDEQEPREAHRQDETRDIEYLSEGPGDGIIERTHGDVAIQPRAIRCCKERHADHEKNGEVFRPSNGLSDEKAKGNVDKNQRRHGDERKPDEESFYSIDQEIKFSKHEQYKG
jgi:hypothetical protein